MVQAVAPLYAFNRGLISKLGLARTDLKRQALSAAQQTNWMPRMLGSMMLRPGLGYLLQTLTNLKAKYLPFVFSSTDAALIECTNLALRVLVNDVVISRVAVGSVVTNGNFATDLSGWTQGDEPGSVSSWITGSFMQLVGTGFNAAVRFSQVTVAPTDIGKEHAVRVVVAQESVTLRIGTSSSDDSYVIETTLGTGTHSLAFTPAGDFFIRLSNSINVTALVQSVNIEAAGAMILPTPWPEASLKAIRYDQSADILFIACDGFQQRKIERRALRSWSIVLYQPNDGPFLLENTGPIQLTPSGTTGAISLTASKPFFRVGHAGVLFKIASVGQHASIAASGTNQWSAPVEVTGLDAGGGRSILVSIGGAFAGTVLIQRSVGSPGAWEDVSSQSYTSPTNFTFDDGFDNQDIFYRIGIESNYSSGTAICALDITTGSKTGICRVTQVVNSTVVNADVLTLPGNTGVLGGLGSTNASADWWEGQWSDYRGWPTSVAFYEGRLWWFGRGSVVGSISDQFASFDETQVGDSGPINRTVGFGAVDVINWGLALQRLILGAQGAEISARSSSLDEPLSPTNFNLKTASTIGSDAIAGLKIDNNGIYVDKSGRRIYQLNYNVTINGTDYTSADLTNFVPDLALLPGGFVALAVQRKPDTRIHGIMADGTVGVMIYDPLEDEHAWVLVQTGGKAPVPDLRIVDEFNLPIVDETGAPILSGDPGTPGAAGVVEDAVVLPGPIEDQVYYVVKRLIDGNTVRYLEKWAREDECWGDAICKIADAYVSGTFGSPSATISVPHLEGQKVVVWADGKDVGTNTDGTLKYTVTGGQIVLSSPVTNYCVGLFYDAHFMSTKLAYGAQLGTALTQRKHIAGLGVIMANAHAKGLKFGQSFDKLMDLPSIDKGAPIDPDSIWSEYDSDMKPFPGNWDTDSRICLYAAAPKPVTILAAVIDMETRERS